MEASYPGSRTDVVEIDPAVTEAAMAAFGLLRDTPIRSFHEDARVFVDRLSQAKTDGKAVDLYDIVYLDAFNNHSVPFQLTTLEFTQNVREVLNADGAYLVNLIDTYGKAHFVGAVINTMQEVFPHVYVFTESAVPRKTPNSRTTFVIAGMNREFDSSNLGDACRSPCIIHALSSEARAHISAPVCSR